MIFTKPFAVESIQLVKRQEQKKSSIKNEEVSVEKIDQAKDQGFSGKIQKRLWEEMRDKTKFRKIKDDK